MRVLKALRERSFGRASAPDAIAALEDLWRRWRRRVAVVFAGQLAVQALAFLTGLLMLRWMSEGEYAKAGVVLGFQSTCALFVDLGIGGSLVALIGNRGHEAGVVGAYVAAARWWRRVLMAVVMPLGGLAFYAVCARQGWSAPDSIILFGCITATLYASGLAAWASAPLLIHQRLGALYAVSNGGSVVRLLGCCALHATGHLDAVSVTVLGTVISLAAALLYRGAARRHWQEPSRSDPLVRQEIRRHVAPLAPMAVFYAVQGQLGTLLIAWFGQAQGIAEVTALGRLGQLFSFMTAVFAMLVIPHLARLPEAVFAQHYRWSLAAVLGMAMALTAAGFALPQPLLWLLGPRYDHLALEVSWSVLAGALAFAGSTIWSIHAARKWVFWSGTWTYLAAITAVQLAYVASVDLSVPLHVVWLCVAVHAVALLHQAWVAWLGFTRRPKAWPDPA
jgi:O-antigen/teichoic acid export membrane protein